MKVLGGIAMTLLIGILHSAEAAELKAERIVTLGSCVTEMMFALGEGAQVAAVDSSSTWPQRVRGLPQVGYHRQLGAEGILALQPTLVLGTTQAGPPEALQKLRAVGLNVQLFESPHSLEGALGLLQAVADERGKPAQGKQIVDGIRAQLATVRARTPQGSAPRVLVLMAAGGSLMVAGRDTAADLMLDLSGGVNVAAQLSGYKPFSTEAVLGLAPEVIVLPDHALPLLGGRAAVLELPGLAQTPAARAQRVVVMDSALLLGLGPRLGDAVEQLAAALQSAAPRTASQ